MKISSRGRYGVRAMLELALQNHRQSEPVQLAIIAKNQDIPGRYLA